MKKQSIVSSDLNFYPQEVVIAVNLLVIRMKGKEAIQNLSLRKQNQILDASFYWLKTIFFRSCSTGKTKGEVPINKLCNRLIQIFLE